MSSIFPFMQPPPPSGPPAGPVSAPTSTAQNAGFVKVSEAGFSGGMADGTLSWLLLLVGYDALFLLVAAHPEAKLLQGPEPWSAPILLSPHDPTVVYHGANRVLKSVDRGGQWKPISGDLTTSPGPERLTP